MLLSKSINKNIENYTAKNILKKETVVIFLLTNKMNLYFSISK